MLSNYRDKMREIGPEAEEFLERFKNTSMYKCHHFRSISGIIALKKNIVLKQSIEPPNGHVTLRTSHTVQLRKYVKMVWIGYQWTSVCAWS